MTNREYTIAGWERNEGGEWIRTYGIGESKEQLLDLCEKQAELLERWRKTYAHTNFAEGCERIHLLNDSEAHLADITKKEKPKYGPPPEHLQRRMGWTEEPEKLPELHKLDVELAYEGTLEKGEEPNIHGDIRELAERVRRLEKRIDG